MLQTENELYKHLAEQIQFLVISCNLYDQGYTAEAKRLASTIRTLVHDTKKSTSLLTHLEVKKRNYYYNTSIPETKFGLCGIRTTSEGPYGKTEYYAPLDSGGPKRKEKPWITFNNWWEEMRVLSDGKNLFTRKELVLSLTNKDGGSHVDLKLSEKYAALTRNNSLNVFHHVPNGNPISVEKIELACVRQIAFELLKSLEKDYSHLFSQV